MAPVMVYCGYVFAVVPRWARAWLAGPAVYALCRRELDGRVTLLHVGETADLGEIGADPAWETAARHGLSEIHVHLLATNAAARRVVVERLRRRYGQTSAAENPVHREQALLAAAFAPPRPPFILDWLEALFLAPPRLQMPVDESRPPVMREAVRGRG